MLYYNIVQYTYTSVPSHTLFAFIYPPLRPRHHRVRPTKHQGNSQTCIIELLFLCPLSSVSLTHLALLFSPSFALLRHQQCLTCPPFTLASFLVFCVLPLPPLLALPVKYTPLLIFSLCLLTVCSALLPRPLCSTDRGVERGDIRGKHIWVTHVQQRQECVWADGCQCVSLRAYVCVCIYECGGVFKQSRDMGQQQPLGFR